MEFENTQGMSENEGQGDSGASEEIESQGTEGQQAQDLVDLDGVQKFKWGGQEWTPKDLQGAILRQSDYTRKTQALAEERKEFGSQKRYYDNLQADLERVQADPALAEKFRQVYPEAFHKFLGYVAQQPSKPASPQENSAALPKDVQERLSRIDKLEGTVTKMTEAQRAREITAINAELDNVCKAMSEKYPFADEATVLARAEALARQGQKMTQSVWDDLWSAQHGRTEAMFKKRYSEQVSKQTQANKAGADTSPGGGIPGQKPVKARSIKEMTNLLYESGQVE